MRVVRRGIKSVMLLSILAIGFSLGISHAMESDHLAAVATLATRQHGWPATLRQGVAWGVGHTLTLLLVGGVILILGTTIPHKLDRVLELCVGIMLVILGADVVRRMVRQRIHFHVHQHRDGKRHIHAHSHAPESPTQRLGVLLKPSHDSSLPDFTRANLTRIGTGHSAIDHQHQYQHQHSHARAMPLRALAVGMMHGLSGSAALVLLSLQTVQSVPLGVLYIAIFGCGSIVGMGLMSVAISVPLRLSGTYITGLYRFFTAGVGVATLGLGLSMVYHIGFTEGLLRG